MTPINRLPKEPRTPRPTPDQPGTLGQQIWAMLIYHADPDKAGSPDEEAWQRARRRVMPHARGEGNT